MADEVASQVDKTSEPGPFGEFASLALRRALIETVGTQGNSLFGSTAEDLNLAFRQFSTPTRFGQLTKLYFSDFFSRTLQFYVEKELSNVTGGENAITSIADAEDFSQALDLYTRQSAQIVQDFAAGWYGKYVWNSSSAISQEEASRFVAVALRKLRQDVSTQSAAS